MLVVDASVALEACATDGGFTPLPWALCAPPLMWSEATSALHELMWRGQIERVDAASTLERLRAAPIERRDPTELNAVAWQIAEELGWAKTYDAEYLALARLLATQVVTLDARLRRGAGRTGLVVGIDELALD